jgi:signal transduction histidine kinase
MRESDWSSDVCSSDLRFYRVEKARSSKSGGSGIGLAIVKDIMSLFGGYIEVKSKPGHGSTFTLVFPVRGEPESKENVEAEPSPPRK